MTNHKNRKYKLNENLRQGDLVDVVDSLLEIDRYKPKLGTEADTVVICFKANTQDVATDLGAYLEWSAQGIEDVEVSNASDKDGKFHVYIELKRLPGLNEKIINRAISKYYFILNILDSLMLRQKIKNLRIFFWSKFFFTGQSFFFGLKFSKSLTLSKCVRLRRFE